MWGCALLAASLGGTALAAGPGDLDYVMAASLPPEIVAPFAAHAGLAFESRLNPFYLHGDFDGDGRRDTAILVRANASGKHGIALALSSGRIMIAGAGQEIGNGGDDFGWMDAWHVYRKGPVEPGAAGGAPPKLRGDALMIIRTESASALLWWDGRKLRWYQQGD
jgi:hypothetical protein